MRLRIGALFRRRVWLATRGRDFGGRLSEDVLQHIAQCKQRTLEIAFGRWQAARERCLQIGAAGPECALQAARLGKRFRRRLQPQQLPCSCFYGRFEPRSVWLVQRGFEVGEQRGQSGLRRCSLHPCGGNGLNLLDLLRM